MVYEPKAKYVFRGKSFTTLTSCYEFNKPLIKVGIATVKKRLKEGYSLEEALLTEKRNKEITVLGNHVVEGKTYKNLPSIARAYGIKFNTIYGRYRRGKRGDDLVPKKKLNNFVEKKAETKFKFFVNGKGFKSKTEACKHYNVKMVTFRSRIYKGQSIEQAMGLEYVARKKPKILKPNKKTIKTSKFYDVFGKRYNSISTLAKNFNLPYYVVQQRIGTYGYTPEEAVSMEGKSKKIIFKGKNYKSILELAESHNVSYEDFKARLRSGQSKEQALGYEFHETANTVDYKGVKYKSIIDFAKKNKLNTKLFQSRISRGMSIEEAIRQGNKKIETVGRYNLTILKRDSILSAKKCVLYLVMIKINQKTRYKIGITTRSVKQRFVNEEYILLKKIKSNLLDCYLVEQDLLKKYSKYIDPNIGSDVIDGYTEVLNLSNETIDNIKDTFDKFEDTLRTIRLKNDLN